MFVVTMDWTPLSLYQSEDAKSELLLNDGTGHFTRDATNAVLEGECSYLVEAADFDNDGDIDLLCVSITKAYSPLFLNDGSGSFTRYPLLLSQKHEVTDIVAFDADNDGDLDVLLVTKEVSRSFCFKPNSMFF